MEGPGFHAQHCEKEKGLVLRVNSENHFMVLYSHKNPRRGEQVTLMNWELLLLYSSSHLLFPSLIPLRLARPKGHEDTTGSQLYNQGQKKAAALCALYVHGLIQSSPKFSEGGIIPDQKPEAQASYVAHLRSQSWYGKQKTGIQTQV